MLGTRNLTTFERTFTACGWGEATHYYHAREGDVFPVACYSVMHQHDCVMPLMRVEEGTHD